KRAQMEGFELIKLPVTAPGVEQKATWLQIRQQRPDYVFVWGWGVMNSAAIKEAISVSYPRLQMYGVWWSSAEPDVVPAEAAGKFKALGFGDMVQPLHTSCKDHGGVHRGRIHTWDGKTWSYTSDWLEADYKVIRPLVDASAKAYAAEKKITPRDCAKES